MIIKRFCRQFKKACDHLQFNHHTVDKTSAELWHQGETQCLERSENCLTSQAKNVVLFISIIVELIFSRNYFILLLA